MDSLDGRVVDRRSCNLVREAKFDALIQIHTSCHRFATEALYAVMMGSANSLHLTGARMITIKILFNFSYGLGL